jgi:two-component system cell cycle response regulator
MHGGPERGGRVLVVAEGGHGPLVRALAAEGHEVDTRLPAEALGETPDVIVVVRPDPAAAVLATLARRARLPVAPVIVLSGAAPPKVRASLLRAGAHTCLRDPVDPAELLAAVAGALAVKRSRDAEPDGEGLTDPVTGLGNRRLGERELDLFVARSTRHGHALSLVMGGLDGLPAVVEAHGPDAADAVLRDAGARFAFTLRSGDVIVRWEADEFLMMLPDTDRNGTHRAAERLRRCISADPFTVGAKTVELTASIGWAGWVGEDPAEFKLRVDRWLRQAREAGGDAVRPGVTRADAAG